MRPPRFRQLPHTADVRLAVWGRSVPELLENAVAGAMRVALGVTPRGEPRAWHPVAPWPASLEMRIVRVINEALFLLYGRREVAVRVAVSARRASLGTIPLAAGREPETEIKAATFHALRTVPAARTAVVLTLDL